MGPPWVSLDIGDDVQCAWGDESMWFNDNYEQLFQYDPSDLKAGTYVPIPWLASNYTVSPDGMTYTINLHQGVTFHSGDQMTSADVVYSVDRFLFDKNLSSNFQNCPGDGLIYADTWASFANITATGPYQVKLALHYPDPNVLNELASQGLSILDSKLLKAHTVVSGSGANATSDYGFAWLDAGQGGDAGTGPYMLTSFTYEQRAQLQSFPKYWGSPFGNYSTSVKTIIMVAYADATAAQFALVQGQINMVQDETDAAISSLSKTTGISVDTSPLFEWEDLYMHPAGPLADWRVREAVKLALNYTAISDAITNGYDTPTSSFFGIGMQGYNSTTAKLISGHAPNDTGAKALLKQAGYPNGFTISLYARPNSRIGIRDVDLAEAIQPMLAAVNITTKIQVYTSSEYFALLENHTLPGIWIIPTSLIILSALSNVEEALGNGNTLFLGWNASTETGPGLNFTLIGTLINESERATSPTTALALEQQLDQYYQKYGDSFQLFQVGNTVAYSSNLKGVVWNGISDGFIPEYISA